MSKQTYTKDTVQPHLDALIGWTFENDYIKKSIQVKDFVAATGFLVKLAIHAEKINHHPEVFNVYNKVDISLSTHDAGGVTDLDLQLAKIIDDLLASE